MIWNVHIEQILSFLMKCITVSCVFTIHNDILISNRVRQSSYRVRLSKPLFFKVRYIEHN